MHQALYRKWRPQIFSDVSGQAHITDTLRKQVSSDRISHAYLFTGTRGTGKTTCAKILAKAVNCQNPVNGDPCNACPSCVGMTEGSILDVLEIDAASYSGVDNIRALRDESVYSPVSVKYRVYIIDEVHMLSIGAFNALLKTLEEPPAHVIFILATTETHKVPATILSRCQRFAFRRIPHSDMTDRLKTVVAAENIEIQDRALNLIVSMADGALRDALSLLDQCANAASNKIIDEQLVYDTLGLSGTLLIANWAENIAFCNTPQVLTQLNDFYQSGKDLSALLNELSCLLRDALMLHLLHEQPSVYSFEPALVKSLSEKIELPRLISMLKLIQDTQNRLPRASNKRLEAELCLIKMCIPAQYEAITNPASPSIQTVPVLPIAPIVSVSSAPVPVAPAHDETKFDETAPLQDVLAEPPPEPSASVSEKKEPAKPKADAVSSVWQDVLQQCNPFYTSFLESAKVEENGDCVTIIAADTFSCDLLKQKDFVEFLKKHYPKNVVITTEHIKNNMTKDRLNALKQRGGDIVKFIE